MRHRPPTLGAIEAELIRTRNERDAARSDIDALLVELNETYALLAAVRGESARWKQRWSDEVLSNSTRTDWQEPGE